MEGLWERIRLILDENGWDERQLARFAGLKSETHVGLIKRSGTASPSTLAKIAEAGIVRASWLTFNDGPRRAADVDLLGALLAQYPELTPEHLKKLRSSMKADASRGPVDLRQWRAEIEEFAPRKQRRKDAQVEEDRSPLDRVLVAFGDRLSARQRRDLASWAASSDAGTVTVLDLTAHAEALLAGTKPTPRTDDPFDDVPAKKPRKTR